MISSNFSKPQQTSRLLLPLALLLTAVSHSYAQDVQISGDVNPSPANTPNWSLGGDLDVGLTSNGTLEISGAGTVSSNRGYIGHDSGSTGKATVSGGSWNNSTTLNVGFDGDGTLEISGTGTVSNKGGYIGRNSGSTGKATVSGGGSWNNSTSIWVGTSGNGTLEISGTGTVSNSIGYIGFNSTGLATVSGGSWNNSGGLFVGRYGDGTLEISGTGSVSASSVLLAYNSGPSKGTLNLFGGTLSTPQVFEGVGSLGGTVTFDGGTLQLTGDQANLFFNFDPGDVTFTGSGGTIDTQNFSVETNSNLSGNGGLTKQGDGTLILSGTNTYSGPTLVSEGTLLVNGSLDSGDVTVDDDASLGGSSAISGAVTMLADSIISPGESIGTLSTGSQVWTGPAFYDFEFSTDGSSGSAGTEWDQLAITGTLDLSSVSSTDPMTIILISMLNTDDPGPLAAWDPLQDATWSGFVTTTDGFIDFSSDQFAFDTSGFQDGMLDGTFSVEQNGNHLDLTYTAVPEPNHAVLLLAFASVTFLLFRRRRDA